MAPVCSHKKTITKDGKVVELCEKTRSQLLEILQNIQHKEGYISDKNMQQVADKLGIHPVEVYSVVSFYSFLSTKKKGKYTIRVSNCISNVMKGNKKIIEAFEKHLKIKCGKTTKNGKFTLEKTSCIGMCDMAPAIMVGNKLIGNVKPKDVATIIKNIDK